MDITITIKDVDPEFYSLGRSAVEAANKLLNNSVKVPERFEINFNDMMKASFIKTSEFFSHAIAVYCVNNAIHLDQ